MLFKFSFSNIGAWTQSLALARQVLYLLSYSRSVLIWCNPICQFLALFPELLKSYSESRCSCLDLKAFPPCFPLVVFKVKVFDPFWIDFCTGRREGLSFSILHVDIQFSQHCLLKRLSFLQHMFWALLSKKDGYTYVGLFLDLLFCSVGLPVCVVPAPCCFPYDSSVVYFEIRYSDAPALLFCSGWLWLFQGFCTSIWTLELISYLCEDCHWNFGIGL
jgi:hypothetical protein